MKFISATEKAYNLELKKERKMNKMLKSDKSLNKETIEKIVSIISAWSICRYNNASKKLYKENNLLKLASEEQKVLLQIFDKNSLFNNLEKVLEKYEYNKFKEDDNYRRSVMYLSLIQIIIQGGKTFGAEYGLVFAKTHNFDLATPMHYASYENGLTNPKLKEYIDVYLKSGGSKDVYWLPTYYSENKKDKYSMEELGYIIKYLELNNLEKQKKLM
ncbi:MAG: hypothetical protein E7157_02545 [Lactobacillales bacterium]|nr:hypothetical protein [Lactobacillales bacterium]